MLPNTSQNRQWITIDSCIRDYMTESEQSQNAYFKLFHLAFRGMDDMGIDFFYTIQSFKVPINANLTVTIPGNVIKINKAGVFNAQGKIIPFYYDSTLSTAFDLSPSRLSQTEDNTIATQEAPFEVPWYNYWDGYGMTTLYGIPSGQPFVGSYKIDEANGVIVLDHHFSYDYVVIEGICSPEQGGNYYIPIQFREAMIAWLTWKDGKAKKIGSHMQLGVNRDNKSEYYNQRRLAIAKYDPINISDLYEWNLRNQRLSIKG